MATITQIDGVVTVTTHTFPTASTTFAACTWSGHCLGASCASNDDCDNDWICANKICSPCCETHSTSAQVTTQTVTASAPGTPSSATHPSAFPSSVVPSPTTSPPATTSGSSNGGLSTVAIIGIGVGGGLFALLLVGVGLWLCRGKKRTSILVEAPDSNRRVELDGADQYGDGERKRPFATGAAELTSDTSPTELQAVELAELDASPAMEWEQQRERQPESEGANSSSVRHSFVPGPEQLATLRSRQARLEEQHVVSPAQLSAGQWSASPVSPEERYVYTSPNGIRTDHNNTGVLGQGALAQQSYVAYHPPEAERLPSGYMANQDSPQMESERGDAAAFDHSEQPHWPLADTDAGSGHRWQHDHNSIRHSTLSGATTPYSRSEDAFLHWPNSS